MTAETKMIDLLDKAAAIMAADQQDRRDGYAPSKARARALDAIEAEIKALAA